jgi:hypothetical protein
VVPEARDYLLTRRELRQLPSGLAAEVPCDVGKIAGRCMSDDSIDAISCSLKGVVERSSDLQPLHPLDMRPDRSVSPGASEPATYGRFRSSHPLRVVSLFNLTILDGSRFGSSVVYFVQ